MHRASQHILVVSVCTLWCAISLAQQTPTAVTVANLSSNQRKFDGHLVRIRAWLIFGWEGDDFLYDPPRPVHPSSSPAVWFYCNPNYEQQACANMRKWGDGLRVLGTFTGYFHFVPSKKRRMKDVFDPGPLQLEVISVSDLESPPAR
jgi:hypothetical protein